MKRATALLLIISLLGCLSGCGKTDVEYYCTEMILEDLAVGDVTRTVYVYDESWNNTEVITYLNEEEISRCTYDYSGGNVTVTTVYGDMTEVVDIANTLDEQGNILRSVQAIGGEVICTTENTYSEDGLLLRSESDYGNGFLSVAEYIYDKNGALLSETLSQEGFGVLSRKECETGSDGIRTVRVLDSAGTLTGYYLVHCDEAGNAVLQEYCDPAGNLLSVTTCTYQGTDGSVSSGALG